MIIFKWTNNLLFKMVITCAKIEIKKTLCNWVANIPTSKFDNRSIQSKIKHNIVKLIIENVKFDMLYFWKSETTHAGMT